MLLIGAALGIPLILGLYGLIRTQVHWWLLAGVAYSLVTVVLATLAPVLLMPLFYTLKPLAEDRPDLVERLLNLAQRNNTSIEGVYSIDLSRRTRAAMAEWHRATPLRPLEAPRSPHRASSVRPARF